MSGPLSEDDVPFDGDIVFSCLGVAASLSALAGPGSSITGPSVSIGWRDFSLVRFGCLERLYSLERL